MTLICKGNPRPKNMMWKVFYKRNLQRKPTVVCHNVPRSLYMKKDQDILKRDLCTWKETYVNEKRPVKQSVIKETCKRDLLPCAIIYLGLCLWKETKINWKRPIKKSFTKETCKRDLLPCAIRCQKRPIYMAKDVKKSRLHEIWGGYDW